MVRRMKIINDPSDLVPILQIFSSNTYKRVYEELSKGWKTIEELRSAVNGDVENALKILKKGGLVETQWRMPKNPGESPIKEYRTTYSIVNANFQCSMKHINELLEVAFMSEDRIEEYTSRIMEELKKGNTSLAHIGRALDLDPVFIKGVAKRSLKLNVKGARVELAREEEP